MGTEAGPLMGLDAPLDEFVQLAGDNIHVSCNTNPGMLGDHGMSRSLHSKALRASHPPSSILNLELSA
jgi:hypothetical protein